MANYTDAATQASYPSTEEHGSPVETWGENGLEVSVKLRCQWDHRYSIMANILDNIRAYPHRSGAFAKSGSIQPAPGESDILVATQQAIKYKQALLTIQYGTAEQSGDPGSENTFSDSLQPSAEMITLDHRDFKWSSDEELKEKEAPGKLIIAFDYVQTRYRLASIPAQVLQAIGTVNNANVSSSMLGLTFSTGTLLYNPPTLSRSLDSNGNGLWTMVSRYSFRADGWNKFWNQKTQTYETLKLIEDDSDYNNYPEAAYINQLIV